MIFDRTQNDVDTAILIRNTKVSIRIFAVRETHYEMSSKQASSRVHGYCRYTRVANLPISLKKLMDLRRGILFTLFPKNG